MTKVAKTLGDSVMDYKLKLAYYDGSTKIFDDENDNINDRKKRDDHGFIEIEPCEDKMLDDFNLQLEKDRELKPILNVINKLSKELDGDD
jgi:hypothetical protein